jgi:hypothetical protein
MAKLSAHGKELLRIELEKDDTRPDSSTTWSRKTRAYMADGKVLEKFDVRFKPDQFRPKGEFYSYGWKLVAKQKKTTTDEAYIAYVRKLESQIIAKEKGDWKVVSGGLPPVIISQKRILAAVESGDSVGFCKACGAETDGVEPDARNYHCESCGMSEVYGAEEFLIAG